MSIAVHSKQHHSSHIHRSGADRWAKIIAYIIVGLFGVSLFVMFFNYRSSERWEKKAVKERDDAQTIALTDPMTGVKNKAAYLDEVRQLERMVYEEMGDFAVLVFDINGLKLMNDTKGHEYGDLLIRDTGAALKAIYGTDKVFRMGGDEFAVILYGVSEKEIAWQFARFDERLVLFNKEK